MSRRKSQLAQRRPVGNLSRLAADVSKYGLNDAGERRLAKTISETLRQAKKWRIAYEAEAKRAEAAGFIGPCRTCVRADQLYRDSENHVRCRRCVGDET